MVNSNWTIQRIQYHFSKQPIEETLRETLTYSVYAIHRLSAYLSDYEYFLFLNKSRCFSCSHQRIPEKSSRDKRREKNENPREDLIKWKKKEKERERRILRMFVKPLSGRRTLAVYPYVYATWAKIASKKTKPLASEASFVARVLHRVFFS